MEPRENKMTAFLLSRDGYGVPCRQREKLQVAVCGGGRRVNGQIFLFNWLSEGDQQGKFEYIATPAEFLFLEWGWGHMEKNSEL